MAFQTFPQEDQQQSSSARSDHGETSSTAGMFSYPSSPLFEQPFANRDFYAEQTPLRSRTNNGTGVGENDAFFAPSNPYFTAPQRRKRGGFLNRGQFSPDRWVKQVMRLVLLSPLIVLVLWSVGAVFFSSSATSRKAMQNQQMQQPKAGRGQMMRPKTLPKKSMQTSKAKELLEEGLLEVVEMSGDLLGQAQPPLGAVQGQLAPQMGNTMQQQQVPLASEAQPPLGSVQATPQLGEAMQLQQVPVANEAQPPLQQIAPMSGKTGGGSKNYARNNYHGANRFNGGGESRATQWANSIDHMLHPEQKRQPTKKMVVSSGPSNNLIVQPQLRGSANKQSSKLVYLYYDPQETVVGADGRVYLPQLVYDEAGNALETQRISQGGAQIFVQPPPLYGSSSSSESSNETTEQQAPPRPLMMVQPQPVAGASQQVPPRTLVQEPVKGMSFPSKTALQDAVQKAETKYQENGSSVIVMTVAVVALLVGALSARKLRGHRSVLSACIENERLDHIVVDSATLDQNNNTAYSTFHWKGDLEKFDV